MIGATDLGARREPKTVPHPRERHVAALKDTSDIRSPAGIDDGNRCRVALYGRMGARTPTVRARLWLPTPAARITASA